MLGVAEIGQSLELVGAEISEHRVHLQDDRKFGLLAHFKSSAKSSGTIKNQNRVKSRRRSVS
jgi:hypothetical protein